MIVSLTLEVALELPDGSASIDGTHGRGWVLPDGNAVKVFAALELNEERDLTYSEAMALGCDIGDVVISAEIRG